MANFMHSSEQELSGRMNQGVLLRPGNPSSYGKTLSTVKQYTSFSVQTKGPPPLSVPRASVLVLRMRMRNWNAPPGFVQQRDLRNDEDHLHHQRMVSMPRRA